MFPTSENDLYMQLFPPQCNAPDVGSGTIPLAPYPIAAGDRAAVSPDSFGLLPGRRRRRDEFLAFSRLMEAANGRCPCSKPVYPRRRAGLVRHPCAPYERERMRF